MSIQGEERVEHRAGVKAPEQKRLFGKVVKAITVLALLGQAACNPIEASRAKEALSQSRQTPSAETNNFLNKHLLEADAKRRESTAQQLNDMGINGELLLEYWQDQWGAAYLDKMQSLLSSGEAAIFSAEKDAKDWQERQREEEQAQRASSQEEEPFELARTESPSLLPFEAASEVKPGSGIFQWQVMDGESRDQIRNHLAMGLFGREVTLSTSAIPDFSLAFIESSSGKYLLFSSYEEMMAMGYYPYAGDIIYISENQELLAESLRNAEKSPTGKQEDVREMNESQGSAQQPNPFASTVPFADSQLDFPANPTDGVNATQKV